MDGKGAWRDNVFVERLWKTIKYEEVYLHAYDTVADAKAGSLATSTSITSADLSLRGGWIRTFRADALWFS